MNGTQLQIACLVCKRPVDPARRPYYVDTPDMGRCRIHETCLLHGRQAPKEWLDELVSRRRQEVEEFRARQSEET